MFCDKTQFTSLQLCGTHIKPHGFQGLSKHNHMQLYPKLGHVTCTILQIPCVYKKCTSMLDNPWTPGLPPSQQFYYQPVRCCTYWLVSGSFNNCNIITFYHESTTNEDLQEIHQVVIGGISNNMVALVESGKYGTMNTIDSIKMV